MLGHEQPTDLPKAKQKSLKVKVNPVTGEVEAGHDEEPTAAAVEEKIVERFEKSCKIPPGGFSTPLW